jgi:hypothetical protein
VDELDQEVVVTDAQIYLTRTGSDGDQVEYAPVHGVDGVYFDETIVTAPGDRWDYVCVKDSFRVVASCVIPEIPVVLELNIASGSSDVELTLAADTSAYLYDVYVISDTLTYSERIQPVVGQVTSFVLYPDFTLETGSVQVYVFAYDENLKDYYTTSNTFFKPNAFRPSYSTVDGGYGTFGAVSSVVIELIP